MTQNDTIPQMHVIAKAIAPTADGAPRYTCKITMKASDAEGSRVLGYRASVSVLEKADETLVQFECEPRVHDEKRPIWTTMNLTERSDIRKKLVSLARSAVSKLKASGKNEFEHKID